MKKHFYLIVIFLLIQSGCINKSNDVSQKKENKIIAYVHGWQDNWGVNFEKAKQITHINYAFANIKNGQVILGDDNDADDIKKLNDLKKVNQNLKILISVGGWSWSGNFSDAVLTEISRQIFANSAIDFMLKHKIDGIDLDWEYPGQRGDDNVFRAIDKENFTSILKLLRKKLDSMTTKDNKYLLTIATGANQSYLDHTNMKEAHKYLDFINIMTYDFYTGSSKIAGHHANLNISKYADKERARSATLSVQQHIDAGIPVSKIVLGIPFYGRWWKGVNPKNNGLYQKANGKTGSYSYKVISDSLNVNDVYKSYWDSSAKAPFIWRKKDSLFITYENERSIKIKTDYVKKNKLAGIMFWQINGDNGMLLKSINDNLN